jgi:hypothetical protein
MSQDIYNSSLKSQTRYPLTPGAEAPAGRHSPTALVNPMDDYQRNAITAPGTRIQSASLKNNNENKRGVSKRYHRNMPSQSINIKKQSVYFQQLYHREKYINTHVPNSFYFRSSEDINENLEKIR